MSRAPKPKRAGSSRELRPGRYLAEQPVAVVNEGVLNSILPIQELLREVVELAEGTEHSRARARCFRTVQKVPESIHVCRCFFRVEYILHKKLGGVCVGE